jgi:UDP-N-acetylmuramyl pentapeptide synthase
MEHELVGKLKARFAAVRHRNPTKRVKVIAVAGPAGKTTTALLLTEMLREAGCSVLTLTNHGSFLNGETVDVPYDTTADDTQRALTFGKQKEVGYVIIELTDALVASHVLPTMNLEMSIITGTSPTANALLDQPVNFAVVPTGLDLGGLSVAPHQAISYGTDESAEAQIVRHRLLRKGTEVELVVDHQTTFSLATFLVGEANVQNLAAATAAAYVLAIDTSTLPEGVARLERVTANYDYIETGKPFDAVVDASPNEASLEMVLKSAATLKKRRLMVAVDDSVSVDDRMKLKGHCDRLVMVGSFEQVPGVEPAETIDAALDVLLRAAKREDLVLLAGKKFAAHTADGKTKAHQMLEEKGE